MVQRPYCIGRNTQEVKKIEVCEQTTIQGMSEMYVPVEHGLAQRLGKKNILLKQVL